MKIVINHYSNPTDVGDDSVYFQNEDGRAMFEVRVGKDGRSIEVRGVETCKVGGVLYTEQLSIEPRSTNVVMVRTLPWD